MGSCCVCMEASRCKSTRHPRGKTSNPVLLEVDVPAVYCTLCGIFNFLSLISISHIWPLSCSEILPGAAKVTSKPIFPCHHCLGPTSEILRKLNSVAHSSMWIIGIALDGSFIRVKLLYAILVKSPLGNIWFVLFGDWVVKRYLWAVRAKWEIPV